MAYNSIHPGPAIDAAVSRLNEIGEIRDESNANLAAVEQTAQQVASNAQQAVAAKNGAEEALNTVIALTQAYGDVSQIVDEVGEARDEAVAANEVVQEIAGQFGDVGSAVATTQQKAAEATGAASSATTAANTAVQARDAALLTAGSFGVFATKALLDDPANLTANPGQSAQVIEGPDAGWYYKVGASGTGSWERLANQPASEAQMGEQSGRLDSLSSAVDGRIQAGEAPDPALLVAVSDLKGVATWLQARTLDGGPTAWAEHMIRDRLGLAFVSFPGILGALVDAKGFLTDLSVDDKTGQVPDWVMDRWAPRLLSRLPINAGKDFYVRGAEVLPVHADMTKISGWGSSTMGSLSSLLSAIAGRLGASYYNGGVGSQMVRQIAARLGSVPALVTVTGGSIPASGAIGVTLSNVPYMSNLSYEGTLGGVLGTISASGGAYTFTRSSAGDAVPIAADTPFLPTAGLQHRDSVAVLNMGKNDLTPGVPVSSRDLVIKYTNDSFDWLAPLHARRLVMGHFVNRDEPPESGQRGHINAVNAAYAARYGDLYFDLQGYLMSAQVWADTGVTPTTADLDSQAIGNLPPSLAVDAAHTNGAANAAISRKIEQRLIDLGWYR